VFAVICSISRMGLSITSAKLFPCLMSIFCIMIAFCVWTTVYTKCILRLRSVKLDTPNFIALQIAGASPELGV
jgi:general stress protein CsbA